MAFARAPHVLHGLPALLLGALVAPLSASSPAEAPAPGVVSIYDVQFTTSPSGDSPYVGQEVTVSGTVTAAYLDGYVVAEGSGAWQAVYVFTKRQSPDIGDVVEVTGTVAEYYGMTEIKDVTSFTPLSAGPPVPAVLVAAGEASQERYESVLLTVADVTVTSLLSYGEWAVSDGAGTLICDDYNDYVYFPRVGDALQRLTGVLFFTFDAFKLEPRATSDVEGVVIPHYTLRGHVVTMNDAREVLVDAYVEVLGDEIVSLGTAPPSGVPVIAVEGWIFPGLIDSHNHPVYDVLDLIPFTKLYEERYEWQADPVYDVFGTQYDGIRDYGGAYAQWTHLTKLAEARALTSGTTTIQGFNCNGHGNDDIARQGILIDNAERFPALVWSSTFPLSETAAFWQAKSASYFERFVIHLSEGTNASALSEFYAWRDLGMLDERTSIVHGVPYGPTEWAEMAAAGASLIWSPASNLQLYGATADVPGALAAGVNVALAPDWTESGSRTVLDELKAADLIDADLWSDALTPLELAEFVTRNAAQAVGAEEFAGRIAPGFRANLMVIPATVIRRRKAPVKLAWTGVPITLGPSFPYRSLLEASPADVLLTVVDGIPRYGSPALMAQFAFLTGLETLHVGGRERRIAIQVDAHAIPDSDEPFGAILLELEQAYQATEPKLCGFVGVE